MKVWELHFCEGSYFMAKEKDTESGIIDNTFTEYIGDITSDKAGIQKILNNLGKLKTTLE